MTRQEIVDACAEAAHEAWLEEKLARLKALRMSLTWPSELGEEQLVKWSKLTESVKDFDRVVVAAIVDTMVNKGVIEVTYS